MDQRRSAAFFNPSGPLPPSKNPDVNWAQLAQRWVAEHTDDMPNTASGNYYKNSGGSNNQQYGSFFLPPPTNFQKPPPSLAPPFMARPPPILPGLNQMNQVSIPPPTYGNPYAPESWDNAPQRPLFQSHANETTKPSFQTYQNEEEPEIPDGVMPHWLNDIVANDPSTMNWMNMGDWSAYDSNAVIDQQMRKKLPAWLLEGLEQAEKDKQKKTKEEIAQKEAQEKEIQREKRKKEKGLGKFDSDSEDEKESPSSSKLDPMPAFAQKSLIGTGISRKRKSRDIDEKEYKDNQMVAIKRLVTDVLLNASDQALTEQMQRFLTKIRKEGRKIDLIYIKFFMRNSILVLNEKIFS